MRRLVFCLLTLLLAPVILLGLPFFLGPILWTRGRVSGTAYEPFITRLVCHLVGSRPDAAALALAPGLPATNRVFMRLILGPIAWACRVTGLDPLGIPASEAVPVRAMVPARLRFMDQALLDLVGGTGQVVILGAGWDSRCYGRLEEQGVKLFEVDTPETQAVKRAAIGQAGIDASHVTFVPCDFNEQSWLDALRAHGFDPGTRTFVLWEAVTMYLQEAAVQSTLQAVASLPAGSRIAFDFYSRRFLESLRGRLARVAIRTVYGEPWVFGIPERRGLSAFVEEQGLTVERHQLLGGDTPYYGFAVALRPG